MFKIHEMRRMLFGEIQNALQEAVKTYDFNDLDTNLATKNEIASRMEAHLRQTFSRSGLGFGQIRNVRIVQTELDAVAKASSIKSCTSRSSCGGLV